VPGTLYVGTDDGQVRVSTDDGVTWRNVSRAVPGLPPMAWINAVHASKRVAGRVYLVANNYRNDDYGNYVWRSDDDGETWSSIVGDLPAGRVARAIREDPRNPDVLWLGTEIGVFWSWNRGRQWVELRGGLPTVAVNDLLVHPRDNDLVLATHGRGIWILDQVNTLQEMTPEIAARPSYLFTIEPAEEIRYRGERAHTGNMIFEGANPPDGAIVDYWLREGGGDVSITVHDALGNRVASVRTTNERGVNRAIWDLRHGREDGQERGGGGFGGGRDPLVVPGLYTVRLEAAGETHERTVRVKEDPRLQVEPLVRERWTTALLEISATLADTRTLAREVGALARSLESGERSAPVEAAAKVDDLERELGELTSRLARLRGAVEGWVGPLSADHASQKAFLQAMARTLADEWQAVRVRVGGDEGG